MSKLLLEDSSGSLQQEDGTALFQEDGASTTRIGKTQSTSWDIRSRVVKSQSTSWNIYTRSTGIQGTTWNVSNRVLKTLATNWDVRNRTVKTTITSWSIRTRPTKIQLASWDVRARIVKTAGSTTWGIGGRVTKIQNTTWTVALTRVVKTSDTTTWSVNQRLIATLLRNLCCQPIGAAGLGWGNYCPAFTVGGSYITGAIFGPVSQYFRLQITATTDNTQSILVGHGANAVTYPISLIPGRTVTGSIFARASWAANFRAVIEFYNSTGASVGGTANGTSSVAVANAVERRSVTAVVPAGATTAKVWVQRIGGTAPPSYPQTIDASACMVTEGATLYDYIDGNTPGWRWTGAVNNSESVGVPYTLESIAGTPLGVLTVPNSVMAVDFGGAMAGRTLYAVHDVIDLNSSSAAIAGVGASTLSQAAQGGNGAFVYRTGGPGTSQMVCRGQNNETGTVQAVSTNSGPRTVGRHIGAASSADNFAAMTLEIDGAYLVNQVVTDAGSGLASSGRLTLAPVTASDVPVASYAFKGQHDLETRKRVVAWLARKYGAPIPAETVVNKTADTSGLPATIWSVSTRVLKTTATIWGVYTRPTKTSGATTWGVRTRVTKAALATTWSIRTRPNKATPTTWSVTGRPIKTTATSWGIRVRLVKIAGQTSWTIAAPATRAYKTQPQTSWSINTRLVKTQPQTSWSIRKRIIKTAGQTTWVLAENPFAATIAYKYNGTWTPAAVKVWTGTQWKTVTLKKWNGTTWRVSS